MSEAALQEIELLLYEVGEQRFGSPLAEVARITKVDAEASDVIDLGSAMTGRTSERTESSRTLVVNDEGGGGQLLIDVVHDVVNVARARIRPMPAYVAGGASLPWVWGTAVLPDGAVVVILELYGLARHAGALEKLIP